MNHAEPQQPLVTVPFLHCAVYYFISKEGREKTMIKIKGMRGGFCLFSFLKKKRQLGSQEEERVCKN